MRPGRKPGGPKTGGRKRGTPNKRTVALQRHVEASGMTPLDYLLAVMRNPKARADLRFSAAVEAAKYVHPRLAAVEHTGAGPNKEIEVKQVSDIEAARLIGRLLTKVSASDNGVSQSQDRSIGVEAANLSEPDERQRAWGLG